MRTFTRVFMVAALMSPSAMAQREYHGPDQGHAERSLDLRRPSASSAGEDVCLSWNLTGDTLTTCRQQWMEAKTEADRLAVRDLYSREKGGVVEQIARDRKPVSNPDATTPCDSWHLKAADLTQCRVEWKSARGEADRTKLRQRYEDVRKGDPSGSRIDPGPERKPTDNEGIPEAQ